MNVVKQSQNRAMIDGGGVAEARPPLCFTINKKMCKVLSTKKRGNGMTDTLIILLMFLIPIEAWYTFICVRMINKTTPGNVKKKG